MEQPPRFVVQGKSVLVCKLCCSLYGLKKQSPRVWLESSATLSNPFS